MSGKIVSKATENDWKYPLPFKPNHEGWLPVCTQPPHRIHWHEYGNPQGEPVMFIHGGPGLGTSTRQARFFDPKRYRVILFDQRGCGESTPDAAVDVTAALTRNTTADLVEDMEKLRKALGITGKMHVFGGSWGSTLSLAYAIAHPDHVASLTLRGIFLCRQKELDYFNQGNAAVYPRDSGPGAYKQYPEAWKAYVEAIPEAERGDMIAAYNRILAHPPQTPEEETRRNKAARAWAGWEGAASYHVAGLPQANSAPTPEELKEDMRTAVLETHYFVHGGFLSGTDRSQNYLLEHLDRIGAPIHLVHGKWDEVCPPATADELYEALKALGKPVDYTVTDAGHSMFEAENVRALTDIMDRMPPVLAATRSASVSSSPETPSR